MNKRTNQCVFLQNTESQESLLHPHQRHKYEQTQSHFHQEQTVLLLSDVRRYAELTCWDTWCCGGAAHHKC